MENSNYAVLLGLGGKNEKVIYCYEKDYKLYVWKQELEDFPSAVCYNFHYVDDRAENLILAKDIEDWMEEKGLGILDCEEAARWYIKEYLKLDNLRYAFPDLELEVSGVRTWERNAEGSYDFRAN